MRLNSFFLINPFWLTAKVTFLAAWVWPAIKAGAAITASLYGANKAEQQQKDAIKAQNEANLQAEALRNEYQRASAAEMNRRAMLNFMFQRGAFGGIESDMVNARNLQQRGRLNAIGLLPKLSYNDTQTREVLNALRQRQSPNTVYDFYRYRDMDDIRSYADQSGVQFNNVRASDQTRDYWLRGDFLTDRKASGTFVPPQPTDRSRNPSSGHGQNPNHYMPPGYDPMNRRPDVNPRPAVDPQNNSGEEEMWVNEETGESFPLYYIDEKTGQRRQRGMLY